MCNDAINLIESTRKKILMISYTNKGVYSIKKEYAKQNHGVIDKNVVIYTWFQFLLRELIKPYQRVFLNKINQIGTVDFSKPYGVDFSRKNSYRYFLNNNNVKANNAAEFVILLNELSNGALIKRLEEVYEAIYIDELQDLVGKDLDLLELLFQTSLRVYCVGDYRQATLKTHNPKSNKKKGGQNIFNYIETTKGSYQINIIKNNVSKRFIPDIATFANLIYPNDPIMGDFCSDKYATGVYQILKEDAAEYINFFNPQILKFDIRTPTMGYPSLNFGVSKGMTFERALVFTNKTLERFLLNPDTGLSSPEKYYVGVTRARHSLAFVVERFSNSDHFVEDILRLGKNEIRVLKFVSK